MRYGDCMAIGKSNGFVVLFGEGFRGVPKIVASIDLGITVEIRETQEKEDQIEPEDERNDEKIKNIINRLKAVYDVNKPIRIITKEREIPHVEGETYYFTYALALSNALSQYSGKKVDDDVIVSLLSEYVEVKSIKGLISGGVFIEDDDKSEKINVKVPAFLVISVTHEKVALNRNLSNIDPSVADKIRELAATVVNDAKAAFEAGTLDTLGRYMVINHGLLVSSGVFSKVSEGAFEAMVRYGCFGAKVSCKDGEFVIGIIDTEEKAVDIVKKMREEGYDTFYTKIS